MARKYLKYLPIFLLAVLIASESCKREKDNFERNPIINITVYDDQNKPVDGARISVYETDSAYQNASSTRSFAGAFASTVTRPNGLGTIKLIAGRDFYILITYYDTIREVNLSNILIGGFLTGLAEYQTLSLQINIEPVDGNIIFYTTNSNKPPIIISIENTRTQSYDVKTLTGLYTVNTPPTVHENPTAVFLRDPGIYKYFAKSQDGCIWADTLFIQKGEIKLINLSTCESGEIYFYTTAVNDTLLPLSVKLNSTDSLGEIVASRTPLTCADTKESTLNAVRQKGLYNYFVKSSSGRCVWTGSFTLQAGDCLIVPIDICE